MTWPHPMGYGPLPMSRRLNREPMPLHKPEACFQRLLDALHLQGVIFLCTESQTTDWSSYATSMMVFDLRGHTYCCGSEREGASVGWWILVQVVLFFFWWNALAKARPFQCGSPCVFSVFFPARVSGLLAGGSLGSVAGRALVLLCCCCLRWSWILGCSFVSLFHLENGLRPNSWRWFVLYFSDSMTDQVAWTTRQLRGKKRKMPRQGHVGLPALSRRGRCKPPENCWRQWALFCAFSGSCFGGRILGPLE